MYLGVLKERLLFTSNFSSSQIESFYRQSLPILYSGPRQSTAPGSLPNKTTNLLRSYDFANRQYDLKFSQGGLATSGGTFCLRLP